MSDALITISGLTFAYTTSRPVLQGVDFELNPGERVALVGPNGAGKSTLFHLLTGLVYPTAGTITAFGQVRKTERDFREVRERVGLMFQDSDDQLFCPTVFEDVAFGPLNLERTPDETRAIVRNTLEQLGLTGYENRVTYRLSGGEKRLVALATVLAMEPDVLLLDEPSTGLDENVTRRVVDVLNGITASMVISSQDPSFRSLVAKQTVILEHGKLTME